MHVTGNGLLVHHFWGTYFAGIVIEFPSEAHARDALKTLGEPWKLGTKHTQCVVGSFESDALDNVKARFAKWGLTIRPCGFKHCKGQCKNAAIDNVNHSVDHGAAFEVRIPVVPAEQQELPNV